jgi:CBS domain-containing protein
MSRETIPGTDPHHCRRASRLMQTVSSVMTALPVTLPDDAKLTDAARVMREHCVGAVMVVRDGRLCGLVTDRDIVVSAIAAGSDPAAVPLSEACTPDPVTAQPGDDVETVIELMRDHAVRRVPVVQDGKPAGMVSLGDLAVKRGDMPVLADICAVPPGFPRASEDPGR